ncbi:phage major capsid protein [Marivita sp. S2033]|uniref:phage major capsid protein n=1 Tax=Marivita sp. S2033 TaxID=3373187 RepID=UPI0039827817
MSETGTESRSGEDVFAFTQVGQALAGLVGDVQRQRDEFNRKFQEQEERMTKMDRKSVSGRPVLAGGVKAEDVHTRAFDAYIRSGDEDALRGLEMDVKSMSTVVNGDGGFLIDPVTSETIQGVLSSSASIRAIASVVNVEASSYDVLVDQGDAGAGWADEIGARSETGTPTIDRISIKLHELSAMPKASQRLLDDTAFDIETWLAGRIADTFSRAEAGAFITGDGNDKPRGILNHGAVDNDVWTWGNLGYIPTGVDGDIGNGDALIELVYALGAEYRANATFVMNSKTAGALRKLKDGDGRHLWSDGFASGEPARLLGYPVLVAEDMPDIGTGADAIAFGDFRAGYTIAERPDLRVLRDPFSAKPHVLFYATKRVGGDVSDFAAIKLLRFATA